MEQWVKTLLESSAMLIDHWKNTAMNLAKEVEDLKQKIVDLQKLVSTKE